MCTIDNRLRGTYKNAVEIISGVMEEHGYYDYPDIRSVSVGKDKTAHGKCRSRMNRNSGEIYSEIFISEYMLKENITEDDRVNTMIHEILHAYFPRDHHGGNWKRYADVITRETGIKIERLADKESSEAFNKNIDFKYILKCTKCGKEFGYSRMCRAVKYAEHCTHNTCGGKIRRIK